MGVIESWGVFVLSHQFVSAVPIVPCPAYVRTQKYNRRAEEHKDGTWYLSTIRPTLSAIYSPAAACVTSCGRGLVRFTLQVSLLSSELRAGCCSSSSSSSWTGGWTRGQERDLHVEPAFPFFGRSVITTRGQSDARGSLQGAKSEGTLSLTVRLGPVC